nr:AAA family ATPase [Leucobacter sp. cx-169]
MALIEHLQDNPNLLLVGPPGTGKTVRLEQLTQFVEHSSGGLSFDPDQAHDAWSEDTDVLLGKASVVVLHPSYTYENLVVGLLPEPVKGGVAVRATPGPLVNLAKFASKPGNRALLVLDEFNRGNAAAILGDTLALLDKDKRDRAHISLPFSQLGIEVPAEYADGQSSRVPAKFTLPKNLWIVAAMNSSDRSVAPLDAALRRRFSIVEVPPDYEVLAQRLRVVEETELEDDFADWTPEHVSSLAVKLLRAINDRIDAVLGSDFRLGQSNFWSVDGASRDEAISSLASAFDYRLVATLKLALQDDDGALAAILRAGTSQAPASGAAIVAHWKGADPSLGTYASARLHLREVSKRSVEEMHAELFRQAS